MQRTILITGGAGFIGSHVVRLFVTKYPDYRIVNLDKLTYAGNLANLRDIEERPNYTFVRGDICDFEAMRELFRQYGIDGVIHLAAESHVDRSIRDPFTFARTNVMGTLSLLEAAREHWNGNWAGKLFYHISTDEVYGALELTRPAGILRAARAAAVLSARSSSPRRRSTTRTAPTRRRRLRRTTSCGPTTTRTACRRWLRTARTTTGPTSSRRS